MSSQPHETLLEMFREHPMMVAELLTASLGLEIPEFQEARITSSELNDVLSGAHRPDLVVILANGGAPVLVAVVEVQLGIDARLRRMWPAYVTVLYERLGCPIVLMVICPDPAVADWCAAPIPVGMPDCMLTPVVVRPQRVLADAPVRS
jgi:hypothetical protein